MYCPSLGHAKLMSLGVFTGVHSIVLEVNRVKQSLTS